MSETVETQALALHSEADILAEVDRLGINAESNLIGTLQDIQEKFNYLPAFALQEVSRRMNLPLSRIYGVVSFYAQFYTEPRGKHTIRCCRGTACHVRGAPVVLDAIHSVLGIDEGQTTPDLKYYLETVACVGTCFVAPVMMIDGQYFGRLTPESVEQILCNYGE